MFSKSITFGLVLGCLGIVGVRADEPMLLPTTIGPVIATALLRPGDDVGTHVIELDVPKIRWAVIGEVIPKSEWPVVKAESEVVPLRLELDGPSALSPSRVVDMNGDELTREMLVERLSEKTAVLVSLTDEMPQAFYLQLYRPETLIVILGPRDHSPRVDLLPAAIEETAR